MLSFRITARANGGVVPGLLAPSQHACPKFSRRSLHRAISSQAETCTQLWYRQTCVKVRLSWQRPVKAALEQAFRAAARCGARGGGTGHPAYESTDWSATELEIQEADSRPRGLGSHRHVNEMAIALVASCICETIGHCHCGANWQLACTRATAAPVRTRCRAKNSV